MTAKRPGVTETARAAVDELAERLGRSVVLNDPLVRPLYGSRHFDDEDGVRIRAVLQHHAGDEVVAHVLAQGVTHWTRPGRIPPRPALELRGRWCAPLRAQGRFLGTLMVIDAADDLDATERADIAAVAELVGALLAADALAQDAARSGRDALLRDLLSPDPVERERGAAGLRRRDFPDREHLVVTVVQVVRTGHPAVPVEAALRSAQATLEASSRLPATSAVLGRRADLLQHWPTEPTPERLREEATRIGRTLVRDLGPDSVCRIGIGDTVGALDGVRAAHRQAQVAVRAAHALRRFEGIARWADLGEYATLLCVPADAPPDSPAARTLAALRAGDPDDRLRTTLRTYLDEAGNAPRTAAALRLHRTSLYYRLARIHELTGVDLDSGAQRLALHLQLRLEDLASG